jgi:hypothetical protein
MIQALGVVIRLAAQQLDCSVTYHSDIKIFPFILPSLTSALSMCASRKMFDKQKQCGLMAVL